MRGFFNLTVLVDGLPQGFLKPVLKPALLYFKTTNTKGRYFMKKLYVQLALVSQKVNRQHIQMAFALLALVLLVLGAGAPEDGGIGGSPK
jgi:hypothetical protein